MAQDLAGLNSLRQALTPYEDVKFELNLNRHPKAHKNKSIVSAMNMKLSKDGAVLENEESIIVNETISQVLGHNYNNYEIINIIPCNTELVLFVKYVDNPYFDIWRYREKSAKYDERVALFYDKGIEYHGGKFSGTFTYTSNDSLIIAFCEYDSEDDSVMNPMMTINLGTFTKGDNDQNRVWKSEVGEFNDRELEPYKLPICPEVSLPQISNVNNIKGNSYIGTYYVYIRYKINKYDYTQWFNIGYPIINEYKQDTIIHQKVSENNKNMSDSNEYELIGTYKTDIAKSLKTYVNQNKDLINNCISINIEHNNILYDYCQIGFICISKTYTKYYVTSDIKLTESINVSTNIDTIREEIFNVNIYENYFNVKNIINKNNKLYISNYKTTNVNDDINTNNIKLSIEKQYVIKDTYESLLEQNKNVTINNIQIPTTNYIKSFYSSVHIPTIENTYKYYGIKYVNLAYYLQYINKESWIVDKFVASYKDNPDYLINVKGPKEIQYLYIAVKTVKVPADVHNSGKDTNVKFIFLSNGLDNISYVNSGTHAIPEFKNVDVHDLCIKFANNDNFYEGTFYNLNDYQDILVDTNEIYPESYINNKVYNNNTLDNKINNNTITGLCQGEVYDFYVHFIDKYGNVTNGYKLENKDVRFKYDFNNDRNPLDVCFIIQGTNTFIIPSENKLFSKDGNGSINVNIQANNIRKLNNNKLSNDINVITDIFIDSEFSPTNIISTITNKIDGLKYLPENILLDLTFGDIFDEEPILQNDNVRFMPYYNSQNELFFKVPKLVSSEGDIQLGVKVEIDDITNYGDYVSYFISHKKLEKTYVLNGFGTKNQLDNILLNNNFETGNIIKLYDIEFEKDWDSDVYDKCTLQENVIQQNGFVCYTNLLNKLAYAQDSQLNRFDRQTTLYLSDNNVEYTGYPMVDDEVNAKYGVKYLQLLNLDKNKYINDTKLYRLGNIQYGSCIINDGLNGKYDKHLAVKYGNDTAGVNNVLSNTGLGSYGNVFLYEIYGFFDYNELGIYLSEPAKFHKIFINDEDLGTDTFYEVITTLNLFNYKISNIYDTWINFYEVHDKDNDFLKEFNRTIYRSAVISDEGRVNNWRYFENDAYKNIEENKGNITNILPIGNYLYVHTEHSLFAFSEDNTLSMNNKNLQVATPDIFDTEYKEVFITKLGYGGLQDKDAWISGQFGYIWFDNDTKKIFKVYSNSMDIVSVDIQEWLENINVNYVRFANDIKNNRILMNINFTHNNIQNNIVLSYNILSKTFISFHEYTFNINYNTKNNLYYLDNNTSEIHQYSEDKYGKNLNIDKKYKLSIITNYYYRHIKYIEYITYKLRMREVKNNANLSKFILNDDFENFPVEKELFPYNGKQIRVYNDLIDTDWIDCDTTNTATKLPDNGVMEFNKPYWDLGNWNFSFLRDVEKYPTSEFDGNYESRLFGNYFIISFNFGSVDKLIEFENLEVQLTKDKEL